MPIDDDAERVRGRRLSTPVIMASSSRNKAISTALLGTFTVT
jgi:hypothetical protein